MHSFKNRSIATVGAIAATVAAATPLRAETSQMQVRYSDLDLDTAAGARTLVRRIHSAAAAVCGDATDTLTRFKVRGCVRQSVARAMAGAPLSHGATQIASR